MPVTATDWKVAGGRGRRLLAVGAAVGTCKWKEHRQPDLQVWGWPKFRLAAMGRNLTRRLTAGPGDLTRK